MDIRRSVNFQTCVHFSEDRKILKRFKRLEKATFFEISFLTPKKKSRRNLDSETPTPILSASKGQIKELVFVPLFFRKSLND